MTIERAHERAGALREALLDHGVRQVSLELVAGRGGDVSPYLATTFRGVLSHHIVSRRSQGLTPALALVKRGRSDLAGPLCNGYGGFDMVARIISLGWANHSGKGGPATYDGVVVPANNGRPYLFGWEFEGGLDPADWTEEHHDFMARCAAGTLDWLGLAVDAHDEHSGWAPGRKIDRLDYTTSSGRAAIRAVLGTPVLSPIRPPAPPKPTYGPWAKVKPGSRTLRLYDAGDDVKAAQAWAKTTQDGYYGPNSVAAVKRQQKASGLVVDGIVGKNTWAVILRKTTAGASTTVTKRTQAAVHLTADGKWGPNTDKAVTAVRGIAYQRKFVESVKYVQMRVGTKADGVWGTKSKQALDRTVRLLQAAWGTTPDGDWGPKTQAAYAAVRKSNFMRY